jgi:signal transduction histidine kinase
LTGKENQSREDFGAVVKAAHDFNNLLSVITGHAALLERFGADTSRRRDSVQKIQQACERGAEIVKQLLGVPNAEDGGSSAKVNNGSGGMTVSQTRDLSRNR